MRTSILFLMIGLMMIVAGCQTVETCPVYTADLVENVSFGNMQVKTELPKTWLKARETLGAAHVLAYSILAGEQASSEKDAQAFFKAQSCDARMELDMYKDYVLHGKEFTPESGNVMIAAKRENDNYWRLKWRGKGPGVDYLIWDIIGVKNEIALHIRVTCPMSDGYEPFADRLECDLNQIFQTLEITPPAEKTTDPAEPTEE